MPRAGERDQHKERFWRRLIGQWQRSDEGGRAVCVRRDLGVAALPGAKRELDAGVAAQIAHIRIVARF